VLIRLGKSSPYKPILKGKTLKREATKNPSSLCRSKLKRVANALGMDIVGSREGRCTQSNSDNNRGCFDD